MKVDNIARHLRQVHKVSNDTASELQSQVQSKQVALPDPIPMDRKLYMDTTVSASVDPSNPLPLAALPFLPVIQCKQCSTCGVIKQSKDGMKRHLCECTPPNSLHSGNPATPRTNTVLAQSIFGGKRTAWFPIISEKSISILQMLQQDQGSAPGAAEDTPTPHLDAFLSEMRFD